MTSTSAPTTGPRVVRVAVVDSGVHAAHPHVQGVAGGIGIDWAGRADADYVDRLGHGTAVAAAIREKAPRVELYAVRVFDRVLSTSGRALVAGCEWAIGQQVHVVNLSLGTLTAEHEAPLAEVVARACAAGILIVAAGEQDGSRWLPGSLPGVCAVTLDWTLPREDCRASLGKDGAVAIRASGYPRPIPGVSPDRNLKGLSFAVANVTGLVAALLATNPEGDPADVVRRAIGQGWCGAIGPADSAQTSETRRSGV